MTGYQNLPTRVGGGVGSSLNDTSPGERYGADTSRSHYLFYSDRESSLTAKHVCRPCAQPSLKAIPVPSRLSHAMLSAPTRKCFYRVAALGHINQGRSQFQRKSKSQHKRK